TRQTRSPADTDRSTPSSSGVPPKVSATSLSWISGGATVRLLPLCALQAVDRCVERGKEAGTVARREGRRAACHRARRAQVVHQVPHRECHADSVLGKGLAVGRNHGGAGFHAAAR